MLKRMRHNGRNHRRLFAATVLMDYNKQYKDNNHRLFAATVLMGHNKHYKDNNQMLL